MVIATICKLLLAVGVGFYLSRKGIFNSEINQKLSYFIINICFTAFDRGLDGQHGGYRQG